MKGSANFCCTIGAAVVLATVFAGCGSKGTPQPTPVTTPNLSSVSLNSSSVVGGNAVTGTVTLSGAATTAATVTLSSNNAAATVPSSVTVNAGSTSGTFNVSTSAVGSSTAVTITATFNGASQTAPLTLTAPAQPPPASTLNASFTVVSLSPAIRKAAGDPPAGVVLFPTGTPNVCPIVTPSGATNPIFDCRFDGGASTATPAAPIQTYLWTYLFGPFQRDEQSTTSQYRPAENGCNFFQNRTSTTSGDLRFIQMIVRLQVRDTAGNVSTTASNPDVRVFPAGICGYGF